MKKLVLLILSGVLFSTFTFAKEPGTLDAGFVNPGALELPGWFKESFLDFREDIEEARAANKRVMLYFYQDGCPYCEKLIRVNFSQKPLADYARQHLDIIAINMWGDREVIDLNGETMKEKDFAAKLRVMFTPTLLFFDENGKVAMRVNGYYAPDKFQRALEYVATKQEKNMRFRDYLAKYEPPAMHGKLHRKPYFLPGPHRLNRKRNSGKPMLVLFEQKQCPTCDEWHNDVLKRKNIIELIRGFDVVQLSIWGKEKLVTPDGKETTARNWARDLDIKFTPSMVFFDKDNREVFRTEAYLRAFHTGMSLQYVSSGEYLREPSFQRFIEHEADRIRDAGGTVDLWK